jgi:hypothetical protein
MLHQRNRSTFSQVLLSHLLGLYLIGFSWHLYVHTQDSFPNGDFYTDNNIAVSEDACAACEWLAHHHFTLNSSATYSFLLPTDFINIQEGLPANYFFQSVNNSSSRAPPFA